MLTIEKLNEMIELHGPVLYRLAYRWLGQAQSAEDVVQETFISAWKSKNYQMKGYDRQWLVCILRRRISDLREKPFPMVISEMEIPISEPPINEFSENIQRALKRLNPETKETFLLVTVAELSHIEVSHLLKIPIGTVLSRVSRARTQLRKMLTKELVS